MRTSSSPFRARNYQPSHTPQSMQLLIKSLERENSGLVQEIQVLKNKSKKVAQLEQKIELVLKHNNKLLTQNEQLAKLINNKKMQVDTWRTKHDSVLAAKNTSSQIQIRKLLSQIDKLKEQIVQIQHLKNLQINEFKQQNQIQQQNIKRSNLSNAEKYEMQIRKLKEYLDKKDYEITEVNMKMVRLNKQTDFQIGKLKQQKQRLRNDLIYEQNEHRRQLDGLKMKFDYNFNSQIENLKKQHLNQIEALDYQNQKLKEVINAKNLEIEQLWIKNNKTKSNYEDSLELMRKQNDQLKHKIQEVLYTSELEQARLRDKLEGIKQSEVTLLKGAHNNQMELLLTQNDKLKEIINARNYDLQMLSKEKKQMKTQLESQILKIKNDLKDQMEQNKNIIVKYEQSLKICDYDLKCKNQQMKTIESYLTNQIDTLSLQRQSLNRLLNQKDESLSRQRKQYQECTKKLEKQSKDWQEKTQHFKNQLNTLNNRSNSEIQQLNKTHTIKTKQLQTKILNLQTQISEQIQLILQLRETIATKDRQIMISEQKIELLQNYEKQLRKQARQSHARWEIKEQQLQKLLENQIKSLQTTRKKQAQQLNSIFDNKSRTFKHQIHELQRQIQSKNKLLNDLKLKYEQLVGKFQEIFSQRAAEKDLDIKLPGWLPQNLAVKSLFDVFLKNKVLQYCS